MGKFAIFVVMALLSLTAQDARKALLQESAVELYDSLGIASLKKALR